MKKSYANTFRGDLSLEGAVSHFLDYLCDQLDAFLEDETCSYNHTKDTYFSESLFGDGSRYEIEIWLDEEENEWQCVANLM